MFRILFDVALVLWIIVWTIVCTWLACTLGGCTKVTNPALNLVDSTNVSMYRDSRDTRETRANENTIARSSRLGGASPVDAILVASPGPRVSYLKGDTRK